MACNFQTGNNKIKLLTEYESVTLEQSPYLGMILHFLPSINPAITALPSKLLELHFHIP
jgi:hypothetical protein